MNEKQIIVLKMLPVPLTVKVAVLIDAPAKNVPLKFKISVYFV